MNPYQKCADFELVWLKVEAKFGNWPILIAINSTRSRRENAASLNSARGFQGRSQTTDKESCKFWTTSLWWSNTNPTIQIIVNTHTQAGNI